MAPISRAVDEKTAQTFLDQSLSQELLLDGKEDAVTFICSKTDDISLDEASANLNIGSDLLSKSHDASRRLEACKLEEQGLDSEERTLQRQNKDCQKQLLLYQDLLAKEASGQTVYAPKEATNDGKKRKRASKSVSPRAKALWSDGADVKDDGSDANGPPLTREYLDGSLSYYTDQNKRYQEKYEELRNRRSELIRKFVEVEEQRILALDTASARCIQGRNEYCRKAIRSKYAASIRE